MSLKAYIFALIKKQIIMETTKFWLQQEFFKCNIPKYRKYFDEWIENVTQEQFEAFEKQRIGQLTKSKCI